MVEIITGYLQRIPKVLKNTDCFTIKWNSCKRTQVFYNIPELLENIQECLQERSIVYKNSGML
jgi:hypothetical protein